MIVSAFTRTDGNSTSPRRHSSTRTGSSPRLSQYHAIDRSMSVLFTTTWSNPTTFTAKHTLHPLPRKVAAAGVLRSASA